MEENSGNPNRDTRNRSQRESDTRIALLVAFGLLKVKKPKVEASRARQLTLDIRSSVQHGFPTKGALRGKKPDQRKLSLAARVATGEPLLVRRGKLLHPTNPK